MISNIIFLNLDELRLFLFLHRIYKFTTSTQRTDFEFTEKQFINNLIFNLGSHFAQTSANWIFPVSTRSLATEHTGIECLTTGCRFIISEGLKGRAAARSYLRDVTARPTCLQHENVITKVR